MERQPLPPASVRSTKTIAELLLHKDPFFPFGALAQMPGGLVGLAGPVAESEPKQ
jgi:hypothetical protein